MSNPMENKLKVLFDYQEFENNPELLKLKQESEKYYSNALSDDNLVFVNAAGDFEMNNGVITNNKVDN